MPPWAQFWGAVPIPGGCRRHPQPGQPAPPAEAGRSPLDHSHEESSWCSWRPFEGRARADGGWACLACSTPSAVGPDRCFHRGSACTRSEPRALGAKCSVTLAREGDTMGNPRFLFTRSPNGRGLAPIGTGQHQICLVRPFLRRKAILWVLYPTSGDPGLLPLLVGVSVLFIIQLPAALIDFGGGGVPFSPPSFVHSSLSFFSLHGRRVHTHTHAAHDWLESQRALGSRH